MWGSEGQVEEETPRMKDEGAECLGLLLQEQLQRLGNESTELLRAKSERWVQTLPLGSRRVLKAAD